MRETRETPTTMHRPDTLACDCESCLHGFPGPVCETRTLLPDLVPRLTRLLVQHRANAEANGARPGLIAVTHLDLEALLVAAAGGVS